TRWGYELRALGHNETAAVYGGILPARTVIVAMSSSGALAGLMSLNEVMGVQHRLLLNFPGGAGYVGIAVALMGRNHPLGIGLAGLVAERSGIVDIGLEGKMLAAAFGAAATAAVTGSAWAGLGAGVAASVLVSLVHGFACITHNGNQVVSGMALNITLSGLTAALGYAWFHEGGQTPLLGPGARFAPIELPGAAALARGPGVGTAYREVVSGHNLL